MWNSAIDLHLGRKSEKLILTSQDLQTNSSNEEDSPVRIPSAVVTLPEQNLIVIGFGNGDIQTYSSKDLLSQEPWEAGPGFRTGSDKPIIFLEKFTDWNPFPEDETGLGKKSSVFYCGNAGSNCLFLYWVLDCEVQLTWIKYQMPIGGLYQVLDACLCPGMAKVAAATNRGRILIFKAQIKGQIVDSQLPIKEHIETQVIVKVAHEGPVTCVTSSQSGYLILSGGKDGKICIWEHNGDDFPQEVGYLYLSNLPVLSLVGVPKGSQDVGEIWVAMDSFIINLRVWNRTQQLFMMEQQPAKNVRLQKENNDKLVSPNSMYLLQDDSQPLLILRPSKKLAQIVNYTDLSLPVTNLEMVIPCLNTESSSLEDNSKCQITAIGIITEDERPEIHLWIK